MDRKKLEHINNEIKNAYSQANFIAREVRDKHMNHRDGIDSLCGVVKDMALLTNGLLEQLLKSVDE